jgi:DNA-binding CsgD family transcriptional regulator
VAAQRIATLSRRERQVFNALVAGRPSKIIAFELGISVRTVEVRRARMFDRLGIQKLADAVRSPCWLNRDRSCGTRRAKTKKTRVSPAERQTWAHAWFARSSTFYRCPRDFVSVLIIDHHRIIIPIVIPSKFAGNHLGASLGILSFD